MIKLTALVINYDFPPPKFQKYAIHAHTICYSAEHLRYTHYSYKTY